MNKNIEGGFLISKIKQVQDRAFEKKLKEYNLLDDINQAQGRILFVLWQKNGISITDISQQTALSYSALTSMIDRLEKSGHVERKPDNQDRRKTLVFLTHKSQQMKKLYEDLVKDMLKIFYQGFSEDDIVHCEHYLCLIYNNISGIKNSSE